MRLIRPFVEGRVADDGVDLATVTAADVLGFVLSTCPGRATASAKLVVTALRSLLGFLHVEGLITAPLAAAVPSVAGWKHATFPTGLEAGAVRRLIGSCDRRTHAGRRDFAMLTLLVRLGLRAGEVRSLSLDDGSRSCQM